MSNGKNYKEQIIGLLSLDVLKSDSKQLKQIHDILYLLTVKALDEKGVIYEEVSNEMN